MPTREDPQQALQDAITDLQARRAVLGDALVDSALAPLLERLVALSAQPTPSTLAEATRPGRRLRQVSVLFLDIVGSTQLIQLLDPEEVQIVVDGALAAFTAIVTRHGGEVLRYAGDNVKAAFGAHDMAGTREDDAERAVHCGLALLAEAARCSEEMKRAHGFNGFNARVGIHTGGVVRGGGVEHDKSLSGLAVNIAARMEQAAPAGTLRISQDTWALVRGVFDVEPQPPLQVKGVDAPMNSYLVRAARDRSAATVERGLQGLSTPMVGRQAELQRLLQVAAQTRHTRQLQALTLLGDAGLGKSRLLREFKVALLGGISAELVGERSSDPSSGRMLTMRAQPDGQLRPWGLLRSVLALECGVADTDSAKVARRKVVEGLSPWFDEHGERQAQLMGQLSGMDFADSPHVRGLDPRTLRDQALAAFRRYLQALAARSEALLVLLVEDLHWFDDSSLDLLQHLLAHAAELPLVLVMTARPTLMERLPGWGPPDTLVPLHPLPRAHGDELARALLQRIDDVPPQLMKLVVSQSEGNPYYMEELVRRLIDDGVITTDGAHWQVKSDRLDTLRLPTTLVGLLQARLDALPAAQRHAARQASVIGHVFWDDALQALDAKAAQALPALQRTAYVREHERSDFEGTPERQFDHHLLHQVTYDTLLKAERKLGHGAAALWLSERTQGRGAEFLAMTGEHAERAGQTALASDCFEQAGAEAKKRFANTVAMVWLRRALALLGESAPARRIDLLSNLARIADTMGDRAAHEAANLESAAILRQHPDDSRQAWLVFSMAMLADRRSDAAATAQLSQQAFELAERSGAAQWAAMAQAQLAWLHVVRQDYPGASRHIEIGLPWAGRIESETLRAETEAQLMNLSGTVSMYVGRLEEARATQHAVLARGEALGSPRLQLGALHNLSLVAAHLGRWDEVAAWGQRMCALAHAIGSRSDVASGQLQLARAAEGLGDATAAVSWHEQSLVILRATGGRRMQAITLRNLGSLHLQHNDALSAMQCCAESQALYQTLDEPLGACAVAAIAALCAVRLGQPVSALARLNAALDQLYNGLASCPANETIELRWTCHQVMVALDDARARPLLDKLYADVQARATEVTEAADRERLIQALPVFRAIVAAHQRAF